MKKRIQAWLEQSIKGARPDAKDVFTVDGAWQTSPKAAFAKFHAVHGGRTIAEALTILSEP